MLKLLRIAEKDQIAHDMKSEYKHDMQRVSYEAKRVQRDSLETLGVTRAIARATGVLK